MIRESYDWWTFKISIPFDNDLFEDLRHFEMRREEDLGIDIGRYKEHIISSIYAHLEAGGYVLSYEDKLEIARKEIMNKNYCFLYEVLEFYEADKLEEIPKKLISEETEADMLIGAFKHV